MKLKFLFLAALFCPALFAQATVSGQFQQNMAGWPVCSTTVVKNCLDHEEIGLFSAGAIQNPSNVAIPANATGTVTIPYSFTVTSTPISLAGQQVSVIAVGKDSAGARLTSDPKLSPVVTIGTPAPAAPTSLTVTITIVVTP